MNAREAAQQAAEAIHALNYATMPWDGYPGLEYPSDVYDVIGSLSRMAAMLPQALGQLVQWIDRQNAAGLIRLDDGGDLADQIGRFAIATGMASGMAVNMHEAFDQAHSATERMAYNGPADGDS